jgi:translation initiation factor 1A
MPKKGGKGKSRKPQEANKRELQFKEDGQDYAIVEKMLGNGWVLATTAEGCALLNLGNTINAHIRGAFRKKVWINPGDVVLLGLREFEDKKADIILKYTPDEARLLKSYGELAENVKVNEENPEEEQDVDITFDIDEI